MLSFNSRLVRLVVQKEKKAIIQNMFQFQIGAIGRIKRGTLYDELTPFQFQIGAIGRIFGAFLLFVVCRFQFQIGAIGSIFRS